MKKMKVRHALLILLLISALITGAYVYFHRDERPTDILHLYGNIDIRQIQLAFQDTGRIRKLFFEEGERVEQGQLVAELDPERFEAAAAQAGAKVEAQREVLARLLSGSRPEEIAEARARVRAAEAVLKDAELNFQRTRELARTQYVSKEKLDNAEASLKSARADLDALKQELILAVKGPRKEDIAAARAQVKADEAALRLAERELADTRLYAPVPGVIQDRILEPGDMAFPQTPVYTLALTDPVWVRAYVSEPDMGKIAPGMNAMVHTDSFPDKQYPGWVGFISQTAEFTPKQVETTELRSKLVYQVRVYVCNPRNELRLGMPVTVTIPLKQPLKVPGTDSADKCREG
jgi:HlyD family secretion protein